MVRMRICSVNFWSARSACLWCPLLAPPPRRRPYAFLHPPTQNPLSFLHTTTTLGHLDTSPTNTPTREGFVAGVKGQSTSPRRLERSSLLLLPWGGGWKASPKYVGPFAPDGGTLRYGREYSAVKWMAGGGGGKGGERLPDLTQRAPSIMKW